MIEYVANGLGGQSMLLLHMACQDQIPARFSITADTGSEQDRVMMDGTRISNAEFFYKHVQPMAMRGGVAAFFPRAEFKDGTAFPPLHEHMAAHAGDRDNVPMFGSKMGRLRQTCTDKWKLRAMRQQLRRLGAKKARGAVGLHIAEFARRASGHLLGEFTHGDFAYRFYQTVDGRKEPKRILWMQHYYPLVEWRFNREDVRGRLNKLGIPYLVTSECDHCPHQDDQRWLSHTPETLERVAVLEESYGGNFFFTDRRIPLRMAIEDMRKNPKPTDPTFGCHNGLCGI